MIYLQIENGIVEAYGFEIPNPAKVITDEEWEKCGCFAHVEGEEIKLGHSLDELKLIKREEVNRARDKKEQGGFEYLGKMFDSDSISCQRISCASQAFSMADDSVTIVWTCQDNSTIELNKTQLLGLVVALAQHSNSCHEEATIIKQKIDSAKTIEELEAIFE